MFLIFTFSVMAKNNYVFQLSLSINVEIFWFWELMDDWNSFGHKKKLSLRCIAWPFQVFLKSIKCSATFCKLVMRILSFKTLYLTWNIKTKDNNMLKILHLIMKWIIKRSEMIICNSLASHFVSLNAFFSIMWVTICVTSFYSFLCPKNCILLYILQVYNNSTVHLAQ